jgi:hypothetical protein
VTTGSETVIAATADARALLTTANEVNFLSGPGRGVILIKVNFPDDKVIGALVSKWKDSKVSAALQSLDSSS